MKQNNFSKANNNKLILSILMMMIISMFYVKPVWTKGAAFIVAPKGAWQGRTTSLIATTKRRHIFTQSRQQQRDSSLWGTSHFSNLDNENDKKQDDVFHIFCDMDGVLCDFDLGVKLISEDGQTGANDMASRDMWTLIKKSRCFYKDLPWTVDGRALWKALTPLKPDILTGVAWNPSRCRTDKVTWCRRELAGNSLETRDINHVDMAGWGKQTHYHVKGQYRKDAMNVITCWSRNKWHESGPGCVLIDDRISLKDKWVEQGGIFIHHTSTKNTVAQLKELGILPNEEQDDIQQFYQKEEAPVAAASTRLRSGVPQLRGQVVGFQTTLANTTESEI